MPCRFLTRIYSYTTKRKMFNIKSDKRARVLLNKVTKNALKRPFEYGNNIGSVAHLPIHEQTESIRHIIVLILTSD